MASIFTGPHQMIFVAPGFTTTRAWERVDEDADHVEAVAQHLQAVADTQAKVAATCAAANHMPPEHHPNGGSCLRIGGGDYDCEAKASATMAATRTASRTMLIRIALPD